VRQGFHEPVNGSSENVKSAKDNSSPYSLPTAAGLFARHKSMCIFCDKSHDSQSCLTAQTMQYSVKKRKIMDKKAGLSCLKVGHMAKVCKSTVKCLVCQKRHVTLMCPELGTNKRAVDDCKTQQ